MIQQWLHVHRHVGIARIEEASVRAEREAWGDARIGRAVEGCDVHAALGARDGRVRVELADGAEGAAEESLVCEDGVERAARALRLADDEDAGGVAVEARGLSVKGVVHLAARPLEVREIDLLLDLRTAALATVVGKIVVPRVGLAAAVARDAPLGRVQKDEAEATELLEGEAGLELRHNLLGILVARRTEAMQADERRRVRTIDGRRLDYVRRR